jgi:hypothetical protein
MEKVQTTVIPNINSLKNVSSKTSLFISDYRFRLLPTFVLEYKLIRRMNKARPRKRWKDTEPGNDLRHGLSVNVDNYEV